MRTARLVALLMGVGFFPGCYDSTPTDYDRASTDANVPLEVVRSGSLDPCTDFAWTDLASPAPFGTVNDMWGASPSFVLAVGRGGQKNTPSESGIIYRYDGSAWAVELDSGSPLLGLKDGLIGVWGTSESDVWVVGNSGPRNAGLVLHYDGVAWTRHPDAAHGLWRVWGSSPSDVFAVGNNGLIRHFDGVTWTTQPAPHTGGARVSAVWGTSPTNVYAVVLNGTVLRYNGVNWSKDSTFPPGFLLREVWGSGPSDIFVLADPGIIVHYDGVGWSLQSSTTTNGLRGIWGLGPDDVYVVSNAVPVLLHYDGGSWCNVNPPGAVYIQGVWPTSPTEVLLGGQKPGELPHFIRGGPPNSPPDLTSVTGPLDPVLLGTEVTVVGHFTDPDGSGDSHTGMVDWGDTHLAAATVEEEAGTATGMHTYEAPGIYTVNVTVTDSYDESDTETFEFVVVYDAEGGFVTGGGWIDSPAGAFKDDLELTGKATFGFVAKYKKGATVPSGNTEFRFKAGDLNFHSTSYEWLVVNQGGTRAQFKGEGTINGSGLYKFMIWADDDDSDTFQIRITEVGGGLIYDNGVMQSIGGGSIRIHTK